MGLLDGERLVRVFVDALELLEDESALFGGQRFTGVGVALDSSGFCRLIRYQDGRAVGPHRETLLGLNEPRLVFQDESEAVLVEDERLGVCFQGTPFTGFSVERSRSDRRFLGAVLQYINGQCTSIQVEWHPNGQLAEYEEMSQEEGVGQIDQRFKWHLDGSIAASHLGTLLEPERFSPGSQVEFNQSGSLSAVSIDDWEVGADRLDTIRRLAKGPVFLSFEELDEFRAGPRLDLNFGHNRSEAGLDALLANGRMDDVEEVTCRLTAPSVRKLLRLPRLRVVEFLHGPPDEEGRELLLVWQKEQPDRTVLLP